MVNSETRDIKQKSVLPVQSREKMPRFLPDYYASFAVNPEKKWLTNADAEKI
jgi:hypothetical protein